MTARQMHRRRRWLAEYGRCFVDFAGWRRESLKPMGERYCDYAPLMRLILQRARVLRRQIGRRLP